MPTGFSATLTNMFTVYAALEQTLVLCFFFPKPLCYSGCLFSRDLVKDGLFLMRRQGPSFLLNNFIVIYCCPVFSVFDHHRINLAFLTSGWWYEGDDRP